MHLVEQLQHRIEPTYVIRDVRIGGRDDLHAQLGTALGDDTAVVHAPARLGTREAVVVNLDAFSQLTGVKQNLVVIDVEARAANMAEDEHLGVVKRAQIGLRHLRARGTLGEGLIVHARDDVVAIVEHDVLEQTRLIVGAAAEAMIHPDVVAEEMPLEVDDVGLGTMGEKDPVHLARPHLEVLVVLEVARVVLGPEHRAVMLGGAEQLEPAGGCGAHVLLDRRVGVAREERVRMGIAKVLEHGVLLYEMFAMQLSHVSTARHERQIDFTKEGVEGCVAKAKRQPRDNRRCRLRQRCDLCRATAGSCCRARARRVRSGRWCRGSRRCRRAPSRARQSCRRPRA